MIEILGKLIFYVRIVFFSFMGLLVVGVLGFWISDSMKLRPFQKNIETYLEKPQGELLTKNATPKNMIAISGKLIVVNLDEQAIDRVVNRLPQDLKPENLEQVKTVLWLQCKRVLSQSFVYSDYSPAYNNECNLTFIDLNSKKYLWSDKITSLPPKTKRKYSGVNFSHPDLDILTYLENIPRKD